MEKVRAVALYSGGLDSILAIKIILEQNIDVIGLQLVTPFIEQRKKFMEKNYFNIPLIRKDMTEEFKKILIKPEHGYGKNTNPCIDCRILMYRMAGEIMKEEQASFIISGEVLGQRPMSQNKKSLMMISRESGYSSWIVRPLSALLLPETEPEKAGIICRSKLMDIQGRSRKKQIELARMWGINEFPAPAGGCKLTEPGFTKRLRNLLKRKNLNQNDLDLLKVGRHFILHDQIKLIVGRNEKENKRILNLVLLNDILLSSYQHKGPVALLRFYNESAWIPAEQMDPYIQLAGKITARYCDRESDEQFVDICLWNSNHKMNQQIDVEPLLEQEIEKYQI